MKTVHFIALFLVVAGLTFVRQDQTGPALLAFLMALVLTISRVDKKRIVILPKRPRV